MRSDYINDFLKCLCKKTSRTHKKHTVRIQKANKIETTLHSACLRSSIVYKQLGDKKHKYRKRLYFKVPI